MEIRRYERAQLGTKSLQRLGGKLASDSPLSDEEEALYRDFIVDADRRRVAVQGVVDRILGAVASSLPRLGVESTGRTKTRATLVEKLRRDPHTKLPSIRDVAGIRVVADCSLVELELAVGAIKQALEAAVLRDWGFGNSRLIDRLGSPMFGYRAIHLEVRLDGAPVEIQFRTQMQHEWAQLMELVCDRWGREPRYGQPIVEPNESIRAIKESTLEQMQVLSRVIAATEQTTSRVGFGYINFDELAKTQPAVSAEVRERYANLRIASEPVISQLRDSMRESVDSLQSLLSMVEALTVGGETP